MRVSRYVLIAIVLVVLIILISAVFRKERGRRNSVPIDPNCIPRP
jgi:hypothetical protein